MRWREGLLSASFFLLHLPPPSFSPPSLLPCLPPLPSPPLPCLPPSLPSPPLPPSFPPSLISPHTGWSRMGQYLPPSRRYPRLGPSTCLQGLRERGVVPLVDVLQWDAGNLPLKTSSVDVVVTDLVSKSLPSCLL